MANYPKFGDLLDSHLTALDISGSQLARRLRVNPGTVTRWRSNHSRPGTPEMIVRIADVLGCHGEERDILLRATGYAPSATEPIHQNDIKDDTTVKRLSIPSHLPNPDFRKLINRNKSLSLALNALQDNHGQWIIGIDGIGGIGKTALAHGLIQICQEKEYFACYIWISATDGLSYDGILNSIMRELGSTEQPSLDEQEKARRVMMMLRQYKTLIILDNLETATEDQDSLTDRLFPLLNPSKAICTSRRRFQGDVLPIHLEGLDAEATAQLIRQVAQERKLSKLQKISAERATEFTEISGGSPLIIKLAVGQASLLRFTTVMRLVRNARIGTRQKSEEVYHGIYLPSWKLLSTDAQKLLIAFALLIPGEEGGVDLMMAVSGQDEDIITDAIRELWQLSLAEVAHQQLEEESEDDEHRYYLHPLTAQFVLQYVCDSLDFKEYTPTFDYALFLQTSVERVMIYLKEQITHYGEQPPPVQIRRLAMRVLGYGLEIDKIWTTASQLLIGLAPSMEQTGHRTRWISCLKRGIEQSQALQDVQAIPELNLHLGILYQLLGDYTEADACYASSIADFELIEDTQGQAKTMIRQAQKCRLQRRYEDASQLIENAFKFLAEDDHERARGYTVLGEIALDDERSNEAVDYFEKSLRLWKLAGNRHMIAWGLTNLGTGLRALKRYKEATAHYREAILILGDVNEPIHWAVTHMNLGNVSLVLDEPEEALRLYALAEPVFRKIQDQLRLALVNYNCGIAYYHTKQWQQSEDKYLSSVGWSEQIGNIELESSTLVGLGSVYLRQGEYDNAQRILLEALNLLEKFEGEPGWADLYEEVQQLLEEVSHSLN